MQPDAGAAVRRLGLFACSLLLSGCSYRCCRSPPGAATACSLNSLQSSAAVHPAVVVFPRPSWLSHVQAVVHLLVAAAVVCSLRCLCMRPAAAPSAVVVQPVVAAVACGLVLPLPAACCCYMQPAVAACVAVAACGLVLFCMQSAAVLLAGCRCCCCSSACRCFCMPPAAAAAVCCCCLHPVAAAATCS